MPDGLIRSPTRTRPRSVVAAAVAMGDHSDSDSSPKSSSSSSSPSARRRSSPQRSRAHTDETGSSDGVLVELPTQEARSPGADPDSGVLVNMPADDATSGETFDDAPEDLAAAGSLSARSLDESIAVIDFPEVSSTSAELRKYQEEKAVFAREAVALRRLLQEMLGQEASVALHGEDADETLLHSMLDDCSRLVLELNSMARAREQEIESLHARAAEAEVSSEVAHVYLGSWREGSEQAVGRMLASIDAVVRQDDASFEGADQDGISILERKTSLLVERYRQASMGIEQLEQILAEVKPGFAATGHGDLATTLSVLSDELVGSKRNEVDLLQKMNAFAEEKKAIADELEEVKAARNAVNAEASKAKAEFEQMEQKLSTTKEKLSMAVTKGKSLVQHRDSLKQALAEKTGELQSCMTELQKKSDALQAAESRVDELQIFLDEKTSEHEKCLDELRDTYSAWEAAKTSMEQLNESKSALHASLSLKDGVFERIEDIMSEATFPEDLLSLEMTDRLGWLVEQKKIADMIFSEHQKVKEILSSVDIPHSVLTSELDSQISWLASSLNQAKDDAVRLRDESAEMLAKMAAHESKLVSMHEEIDRLTIILLKDLRAMSSKCIYCVQQIEIVFDDMVDLGYAIDLATGSSSIGSELEVTVSDLKNEDTSDYSKVADTLLATIDTLKSKSEKLSTIKGLVITSLDDFKMKLKQAEAAAETASHEHQLSVERVCMLEKELKILQDECNKMELNIQEYKEREGALKARELELLSVEHTQISADRGLTDNAISKDQTEALVEKISKLNMLSGESNVQREEATSPLDKLFVVIDEFSALQHEVETLRYENEDLQLNIESYTREIEQLREVSRNSDLTNRELESKGSELLEVAVSMERMIQRLGYLGGKDVLEDNKPASTQALLSKLEKLIIASSTESGNSKSIIQELGAKLQSREKAVDELSTKVKMLEDLCHAQLSQPEPSKDRSFEASSSTIGSDMSDIEDAGPVGKTTSVSSVSTAAHARTMRKGSADHLVVNIGSESERLIAAQDSDDKGRIKSLHTSGFIPAQGKHIADRVDAFWVSGSQILMNRPRARLGLMLYWLAVHLWLMGSIL
ncbi:hypothetical protein ZEAMMB73_Zm00001d017113 [Zea mays]|uniref:Uncharacterized protein n=1 Tax=Zea mays TaxID=4577 RepID=A0A1D6HCC4_MAIZE|nr:hypothetical protein ZEAMMB73_Zm00001d017113 [Zea mays]